MSTPSNTTIQRDGRRWAVDDGGIQSLTRRYRIQLGTNYLGTNDEAITFSDVPAIGSAHPSYPNLKVASYDVIEGEGTEKKVLDIDVKYERAESESTTPGEGETAEEYAVEQWGWEPGTDERELVTDVDGNPVLNSAGDPFDKSLEDCSGTNLSEVIRTVNDRRFIEFIGNAGLDVCPGNHQVPDGNQIH